MIFLSKCLSFFLLIEEAQVLELFIIK